MKTWHKCLLGSLGALMPLVMSLYYAEWEAITQNVDTYLVIGYLVKVVILITVGGLIGFFYRTEESAMKLFQLGIAAPSIILGFINGEIQSKNENQEPVNNSGIMLFHNPLINRYDNIYYFQPDSLLQQDTLKVNTFSYPKKSPIEQLIRGFKGQTIKNNWFLIYDSYSNKELAKRNVIELRSQHPTIQFKLYQTEQLYEKYQIIVGEYLEYKEGLQLRNKLSRELNKPLELWEYEPESK